MGHFTYTHLPAQGLGRRDPRRPHVTGGIGGGIPTFIHKILEWRIYENIPVDLVPSDRDFYAAGRDLVAAGRHFATTDRYRERVDRIFASIESALSTIDRSARSSDRTFESIDRDLN